MYKDKDKRRDKERDRQRRYRYERGLKAYPKGVTGRDTKGVTSQDVTKGVTQNARGLPVIDEVCDAHPVIPPIVILPKVIPSSDTPDKQKADAAVKAALGESPADKAVREALGIPKEGIPSQGIPPIERIPKGVTKQGMTKGVTVTGSGACVIPSSDTPDVIPKLADELSESIKEAGKIRRGEIKASRVTTFPKRGKDIKCFADLPPDVQQTIDSRSTDRDGRLDKTIKAIGTAIAINYQHLFPDRYHSTGLRPSPPIEGGY